LKLGERVRLLVIGERAEIVDGDGCAAGLGGIIFGSGLILVHPLQIG
jgi:hypothetical protein